MRVPLKFMTIKNNEWNPIISSLAFSTWRHTNFYDFHEGKKVFMYTHSKAVKIAIKTFIESLFHGRMVFYDSSLINFIKCNFIDFFTKKKYHNSWEKWVFRVNITMLYDHHEFQLPLTKLLILMLIISQKLLTKIKHKASTNRSIIGRWLMYYAHWYNLFASAWQQLRDWINFDHFDFPK